MASQVLLVAGTHGNEINAPWLLKQWSKNPFLIKTSNIKIVSEIGNPRALQVQKRYINRDLNRSFDDNLRTSFLTNNYEIKRAKELISKYGPNGKNPCKFARMH